MLVSERNRVDLQQLQERIDHERDALRRDRFRAVRLALEGKEAPAIAEQLGRSRRSVQDWVYAYRDGGIGAIQPKPQPGRKPKRPPGCIRADGPPFPLGRDETIQFQSFNPLPGQPLREQP